MITQKYITMNYFEGNIQYQFDYTFHNRSYLRNCSYKNGGYLSAGLQKNGKPSIVNHLYTQHNNQYYKINHRAQTIWYRPREIYNQKVLKVRKGGKELICGYECHIFHVLMGHQWEGDHHTWQTKMKFWYCPGLLIDPQYFKPHQYFYYYAHPDIFQPCCFALKWQVRNIKNNVIEEVTAQKVSPQAIDPAIFTLEAYPNYQLIDWQEKAKQETAARQASWQEYFLKTQASLEITIQQVLRREITDFERNNPMQALMKLRKTLPKDQQSELLSLFFKNMR